jgi:hypothetical protein
VYRDVERVGEGAGFGVPVIVCSDETYFSGTSKVCMSRGGSSLAIRKEFLMNLVARNALRGIKLENRKVRTILKHAAEFYREHKHLRSLTLKSFSKELEFNTCFIETEPIGSVVVDYTIIKGGILIRADFRLLKKKDLDGIFVLNEQGTRFFRKYSDSEGNVLADENIGAYDCVTAERAEITDLSGRIGFGLHQLRSSLLRRGREFLEGTLDWVGLDYDIDPKASVFEYKIEILGVQGKK